MSLSTVPVRISEPRTCECGARFRANTYKRDRCYECNPGDITPGQRAEWQLTSKVPSPVAAPTERPRALVALDELVICPSPFGGSVLDGSEREIRMSQFLASRDPDNECPHGRLPQDGCWDCPELPTPVRPKPSAPAVSIEEARQLMTTTTAPDATPEAPFGFKADGTPRKRPAPSPEQMQAARRGRERALAAKKAQKPAVSQDEARKLAPDAPDSITAQIDARLAELRDEEERLVKARAALVG